MTRWLFDDVAVGFAQRPPQPGFAARLAQGLDPQRGQAAGCGENQLIADALVNPLRGEDYAE